jgi:Rod binding domain-containing protein
MSPLAASTAGIPNATTAADPAAVETAKRDKEKTLEAARQFEAMMLRHVLSSLEKTTSMGGTKSGGNSTYKSMMVYALADGLAQAGGLGLSDLVSKMLEGELGAAKK